MNFCPDSIDALVQLSNLRILRCRDSEAKIYMDKVFSHIFLILENNNNNITNNTNELFPSSDIIMNLAKNYSELKILDKAIKLYDFLININDQDVI